MRWSRWFSSGGWKIRCIKRRLLSSVRAGEPFHHNTIQYNTQQDETNQVVFPTGIEYWCPLPRNLWSTRDFSLLSFWWCTMANRHWRWNEESLPFDACMPLYACTSCYPCMQQLSVLPCSYTSLYGATYILTHSKAEWLRRFIMALEIHIFVLIDHTVHFLSNVFLFLH